MSTLPPDLEAYVQQKLAAGEFESREAFTAAATRAYRDLEQRHAELKADIQAAIAEIERGRVASLDIDAIKAELVAELEPNGQPKAQ